MMLKVYSAREHTSSKTAVRGIRRIILNGDEPLNPPRHGNLLRVDRKRWRPSKFLVVSSSKPVKSVLIVRDQRQPVELVRAKKGVDSWHVFKAE